MSEIPKFLLDIDAPNVVELKDGKVQHIDWSNESICRVVEQYCGHEFGYFFRNWLTNIMCTMNDMGDLLDEYDVNWADYIGFSNDFSTYKDANSSFDIVQCAECIFHRDCEIERILQTPNGYCSHGKKQVN